MEQSIIARKKRQELEEKIEKFFEDRRQNKEALFQELEEAVRRFGQKELELPKLLGLLKYEIGAWQIFLAKIGVSEKEIEEILSGKED